MRKTRLETRLFVGDGSSFIRDAGRLLYQPSSHRVSIDDPLSQLVRTDDASATDNTSRFRANVGALGQIHDRRKGPGGSYEM
jgi:hypothetical protein